MVNNWEEVVKEQLSLIKSSGLYNKIDSINIGALGHGLPRLKQILKAYPKAIVRAHSLNKKHYEYYTLQLLYDDCMNGDLFQGLYMHTKGVSFPKISGGKYWRDYMGHYNITKHQGCIDKLSMGYSLCGVKFLEWNGKPHYSGNFFWFNSVYIQSLKSVDTLNQKDRFQAEFWSCSNNGLFANMSNEHVDYDTKGTFAPPTNYVHTLAYNLVSETEKSVKLLYELNDKASFKHVIVDLGFPLEEGNVIPDDIEQSKRNNTKKLKALAKKYGSLYYKTENVGVSQNWTAAYKYCKLNANDVLIGLDPDEHTQCKGWVAAMAALLRSKHKIGLAILSTAKQVRQQRGKAISASGYKGVIPRGFYAWALIGFRGDFIEAMGGKIPVPKNAERYGWIENEVTKALTKTKFNCCLLPDYTVKHTDYTLKSEGSSKLLREWKNLIVHQIKKYGQPSLDEYLVRKRKGEHFN